MKNEMKIEFDAIPENEGFARVAVASFVTACNPTLEEISDIKTAVSEAVTNAVIHGYPSEVFCKADKKIRVHCKLEDRHIWLCIEDDGVGIADVEKAMEPLFTTRPEWERSGMGFAFMEAFMDKIEVTSTVGVKTSVVMEKTIGKEADGKEDF